MLRVKISSSCSDPFLRQTPARSGIWSDVAFVLGDDQEGPYDLWVVLEGLSKPESHHVRGGNVVFVPYEPPSIRSYDPKFVQQFASILTFRDDLGPPNIIRSHPLLPWWIGTKGGHAGKETMLDFDDLKQATFKDKLPIISAVCSNKTFTENHRKRLDFIVSLKEILGDRLHVFGPGFREWPDKWPDKWGQIAPYQYHLTLENSCIEDYWTEKVADTFLGGAYLFYWGCPNLDHYFSCNSYSFVDRDDPMKTAAHMIQCLDRDQYSSSRDAVLDSRTKVLNEYNLFAELAKFARSDSADEKHVMVELKPEVHSNPTSARFSPSFVSRVVAGIRRLLN